MNERMKELKIMKTTMVKVMGYRLLVMVVLALLPALAVAVEYKSTYCGYSQPAYGVAVTATAPSATFQSTSAFSNQWAGKEDVESMLNADGSVNEAVYTNSNNQHPGRPRKVKDPDDDEDDLYNGPLEDALLPLLLMALVYFAIRRKRTARP